MVGGEQAAFDRFKPYFEDMGNACSTAGPPAKGSKPSSR